MTARISTALQNFLGSGGSLRQAFNGGKILGYSGAQPASADAAVSGSTLLCVFTENEGAHIAEVQPLGIVTLGQTGAGTGTVDTFTIDGVEIMGGAVASLATIDLTAAAVVRKINNNRKNNDYVASNVAGVVTITGKPGMGALHNGDAIAVGVTAGTNTITQAITSTTFGSGTGGGTAGVDTVNGLTWESAANGSIVKNTDETWSGLNLADGTIGWYRRVAAVSDPGTADSSAQYLRMDGAVASSGVQLTGSTNIIKDAVSTIKSATLTIPAS